jgi:hypothetical protein
LGEDDAEGGAARDAEDGRLGERVPRQGLKARARYGESAPREDGRGDARSLPSSRAR